MTNDNKNSRIGYRYLFDSKGCSLAKLEENEIHFTISEKYDVQVYFGTKPRYKIDSVIGVQSITFQAQQHLLAGQKSIAIRVSLLNMARSFLKSL
ncbi:MAG: hypothetical protein A2Y10_17165 [Planctomycetes bacterium GWF2_41_51]|nr:MAG: hypothetical protein A2Y10_17165 [Planctomycetes bacterium GWF2_41_51]